MEEQGAQQKRHRSPNFPVYSLGEVVEAARKIYDADRLVSTEREVAARHLGYDTLNGASSRILSSLGQFGLSEDAGTQRIRLTSLAESILLPKSETEKAETLRVALFKPKVFAKLLTTYSEDSLPSSDTIKAHLVREEHFRVETAKECERSLRRSLDFVRDAEANAGIRDQGIAEMDAHHDEEEARPAASNVDLPPLKAIVGERIGARLSDTCRAEVVVSGTFGSTEQKRLSEWLLAVVTPWSAFIASDETAQ